MNFSVEQVGKTVTAAVHLHNFLADKQESGGLNEEEGYFFRSFSMQDEDNRISTNNDIASPVATDNNEPHPGGRPSDLMNALQGTKGKEKHNEITAALYSRRRLRPLTSNMKYNLNGQVYFAN